MCQRNWSQYNRSLVQRGSLTFFCDPQVLKSLRNAKKKHSKIGGRPAYPDQLIILLIMLKISYSLTYRSCEGLATSIFSVHGIKIPSYITICRGMRRIANVLPKLSMRRPRIALIDSSGFKISGEGEWKTKVHGKSYRRSWLKVHILVDSKTNEIIDVIADSPAKGDITGGLEFLERMPKSVSILLADGAYDGQRFRLKAYQQEIHTLIPPPSGAILSSENHMTSRDDAIRIITALGGDKQARQLWGRLVGYNHRVKAESAFSRLKRLFGEGLFSRRGTAQRVEIWLKALMSNIWLSWSS